MAAENNESGNTKAALNPLLKEAQDAAAIAKAQKELVEYQRDRLKAEMQPLGTPAEVKAPSGDVTSDQSGFVETQMLGHEAARKISELLARDMDDPGIKTLVIYYPENIGALSTFTSILQELGEFNREMEQKKSSTANIIRSAEATLTGSNNSPAESMAVPGPMAVLAAPAIATGIVKSVADLINLFRTTTQFQNKEISVTEDLIVSHLVSQLPSRIHVYYPKFFPAFLLNSPGKTELYELLRDFRANRFRTGEDLEQIESLIVNITDKVSQTKTALADNKMLIASEESKLDALSSDDPKRIVIEESLQKLLDNNFEYERRIAKYNQSLAGLEDLKIKLLFLVNAANQILSALEAPDPTTNTTPLAKLTSIAQLHSLLKADGTYTLRFTVAANGTTRIKKNLFTNAKVEHSAGATLAYQLFNNEGLIVRADSFQCYFDWQESELIRAAVETSISNRKPKPPLSESGKPQLAVKKAPELTTGTPSG